MRIKNLFVNFLVLIFISVIINCANSVKVNAISATNIMGKSQLTQEQALNYFRTRNNVKSDQSIKEFISMVWQEANIEGIKADVAFMQIMKETNFLKFTGDVKESQNNFAGIGATGNGVCGVYFKDTRTGVRAVIQHLKAYSSTEELKNNCVYPRFTYVERGIAPYVEWLGIGENPNYPDKGWAADSNYGKSIVTMMNSAKCLSNSSKVEKNTDILNKAIVEKLDVSLNGNKIVNDELKLGQVYTIKAYGSSSNGVLYEYWIKDLAKNSWTKIRDYSISNEVTWTPNKSGKYLIGVHVKDKYSKERLDNHKYEEYNVQGNLIKTIVLDAGHGGRDSGALSSQATGRLHEADIVQKITIKLGNLLKKVGYNIIYTRDKVDNYNYHSITQNLEDRINVANSIKADLFMSIHTDSFDIPSANGYSTHYSTYRPKLDNSGVYKDDDGVWYDRTPCDAALKSKVLSHFIVNEMSSLGRSNRGISDHNLYVTKNTLMTSILVETGFVSNDTEVRKLNSDSYKNQIAQKLYNAVVKLFSI